ncbi:hypothetical protein CEXT_304871 [Caerostris extrusa]|uniref:Uncharacterized protein n=1 Tax=Caerostris extrusa TaxID=172846 RepID=A0AAV4XGY8_CAEEX|nr:hypothetical protein CEXT_304871 [Caerostris extrusa]
MQQSQSTGFVHDPPPKYSDVVHQESSVGPNGRFNFPAIIEVERMTSSPPECSRSESSPPEFSPPAYSPPEYSRPNLLLQNLHLLHILLHNALIRIFSSKSFSFGIFFPESSSPAFSPENFHLLHILLQNRI